MNIFSKKYRFFKKKVEDVQCAMWELEFKIAKSRQVREGIRMDRDRSIENTKMLEGRIAIEKNEEEKKKQEEQLVVFQENTKRYEAQMKMIDDQITGIKAEGNNPGQQGLLETLASYAELKNMYKSYIK